MNVEVTVKSLARAMCSLVSCRTFHSISNNFYEPVVSTRNLSSIKITLLRAFSQPEWQRHRNFEFMMECGEFEIPTHESMICVRRSGERNQNNFPLVWPWPWTSERFSLSNLHQLPADYHFSRAPCMCRGLERASFRLPLSLWSISGGLNRPQCTKLHTKSVFVCRWNIIIDNGWWMIYEAHILDECGSEKEKDWQRCLVISQAICLLIVLSATNRAVKLVFG